VPTPVRVKPAAEAAGAGAGPGARRCLKRLSWGAAVAFPGPSHGIRRRKRAAQCWQNLNDRGRSRAAVGGLRRARLAAFRPVAASAPRLPCSVQSTLPVSDNNPRPQRPRAENRIAPGDPPAQSESIRRSRDLRPPENVRGSLRGVASTASKRPSRASGQAQRAASGWRERAGELPSLG